jgi:hemolysin activation/secretion protein
MLLARYAPMGLAVSLCALSSGYVCAADLDLSPGALNKSQQDIREYYELLKEERDDTARPSDEPVIEQEAEPVAAEPVDGGRTILITRFEVSPSEVLTPEEIAAVTDQYVNIELDINQLMGVVAEINNLYTTKAQIIARAVLPKQKVSDGVIKIQLIEARLGEIQVEGNEYTRDSFIQKRISLETGELIRLNILEDDLITFNRWNGMALKASLMAGEEFGTTNIVLLANERQQFVLNLFADNAGRETVGENRLGLSAQVASLFGFRDRLSLGGTVSEGAKNFWGLYDIPVHRSGTRVGVSYDHGDIEIIEGPLKPLNVTGDSYNAGITVTQPIATKRTYDWDTSLSFVHKSSNSYFDDVKLVNTDADDLILGTNLRFYDQSGTWLTSHAATFGQSDAVKGRDYFIYTGSLIRLQYFQNASNLIFRSRWQLTGTNDLPSFNQIIIGGIASVRGYTEGLLVGDTGYTLSAEYAYPLGFANGWAQRSNVFAFFDHGAAFPFRGNEGADSKSEDFLASIGVGLDFDVLESLSFKLSVGVPLINKSFYDQDDYRVNVIFNWNAW